MQWGVWFGPDSNRLQGNLEKGHSAVRNGFSHMYDKTRPAVPDDPENREAPNYWVWKQRDGTPIRVKDMDDKHLYHTIRMLERKAESRCKRAEEYEARSIDPDEVAFDYEPSQFLPPIYRAMIAVALARGIQL